MVLEVRNDATPEASRPCLFSGLLALDCDSVLCSTWRVKSTSAARSEIDAQEKFISFFKVGVLTRVMSGHDIASLETGAGAKAANSNVDDLSEVIRALDKKAQGEYSLRLLLAGRSREQLRDTVPTVHRIFVDARAQVMEETLGNLSAFYAMFPGNHMFNVFPLCLGRLLLATIGSHPLFGGSISEHQYDNNSKAVHRYGHSCTSSQ
jgi:type IV secretion system protein VirB4